MKKIYLFLILLAGFAFKEAKAQIDTPALVTAYLTSDCIFEGVVQSQCYYEDGSTGNLYTCNTILVSKIFKGTLTCGTVNVITPGGIMNGYEVHVSEQTEFNVGSAGVFMCINSSYPESTCGSEADNSQEYELTQAFQGTIEYLFDYAENEVEGFNSQFHTLQEFYDFLTANGISITNCGPSPIEELRKKARTPKFTEAAQEAIVERTPTPYSFDRVYPKNKQVQIEKMILDKKTDLQKTANNVEYAISEATLSGSGCSKEYVIAVTIKSNVNTTYLDGAIFRLQYNTACVGTNIFSGVTFVRTSDFPAANYDIVTGYDVATNIVQFSIQYSSFTPNRIQVTTTAKPLIYIHIPVVNCKVYANFVLAVNSSPLSTYEYNATNPNAYTYDNEIVSSSNVGSLCDPTITNLSSTSLKAGRGEILTIDGCDFGAVKGIISMNNADGGTPASIALDKYDFTWSDTQIEIKIPSQVDSGHVVGTTYNKHPIGTGPIDVITNLGTSTTSDPVTINSAVYNRSHVYSSGGFQKNNQFLLSGNSDGKYHFKLHPNITNPKMIDCIKAAFRRWSCTTGVPFILDAGTYTANADSDGVNIVKLSSLSSSTNAQTYTRVSYACSINSTMPYATAEIDIEINDSRPSFKFDTTGTKNKEADSIDFFRTILHELGHGLCLHHTLNTQDIMYYTSGSNYVAAANRTIIVKDNDLDAANYVVSHSTSTPSGMTCYFNNPIQLVTGPCYWSNGIEDVSITKEIKVYPNPFSNSITISSEKEIPEKVKIRIVNILGEEIYNSPLEYIKTEKNIKFNNFELNEGIYFILIEGDSFSYTKKIICSK